MNKLEVAARLREVAKQFGGPKKFGGPMGMIPQTINSYLQGGRPPGNKLRSEPRAIGVDGYYVMYGVGRPRLGRGTIVCPHCKHTIPLNP